MESAGYVCLVKSSHTAEFYRLALIEIAGREGEQSKLQVRTWKSAQYIISTWAAADTS